MTEDMIEELEAALVERTGGWCFRIEQDADECDPDRPSAQAVGAMIVDNRGNVLTVELRVAPDGSAQVTTSKHADDGIVLEPFVFTMDGQVMIST